MTRAIVLSIDRSTLVAAKAEETYHAIKELRRSAPQGNRREKDELERAVRQLQDAWWEDVKPLFGWPKGERK